MIMRRSATRAAAPARTHTITLPSPLAFRLLRRAAPSERRLVATIRGIVMKRAKAVDGGSRTVGCRHDPAQGFAKGDVASRRPKILFSLAFLGANPPRGDF